MANKVTTAKTPAAKPATKAAAAKPATKPAAEKKPRVRRTPKQIATQTTQVKEAVRPQANAMSIQPDPALSAGNPVLKGTSHAEIGGYATQPKAVPTGRGRLSPEEAMLQTGASEINPKADTEALSNLHEVETAKLIIGQSLDALRAIQLAKGEVYRPDSYCGGSREKSLVAWARYFGFELTAMVWINGDVKAVTKAFDFNQKNGVYFPQHALPFDFDVYDLYRPDNYKEFSGILIQPFDFDAVVKKVDEFQKVQSFATTLELADRIALTTPLEEIKRGEVLRSILSPEDYIVVMETSEKSYFNERDYGYGGRGQSSSPKGDLLAIQARFSKHDPFGPVRLDIYAAEPRYYHSTLFERVKRGLPTDPVFADVVQDNGLQTK